MQEDWRSIIEFPGYWVSNMGVVQNNNGKTCRTMVQHVNQRGIANVSFNRHGVQYKRSVAVLVASAFVTTARSESFDTPINLDGDRLNNTAWNLLWRPRWYAVEYFKQFHTDQQWIDKRVQEFKTEEVFKSSWDAAMVFGLLNMEVVKSITTKTYAWPTFQRFRVYD